VVRKDDVEKVAKERVRKDLKDRIDRVVEDI
jgi:hypothetical protein